MAALHGYSSTSAQEFRRDPTLLLGDVTRLSFEYGDGPRPAGRRALNLRREAAHRKAG